MEGKGKRIGIVGIGDVVMRYFYPAFLSYRSKGNNVNVTALASRRSRDEVFSYLGDLRNNGDPTENNCSENILDNLNKRNTELYSITDSGLPDEFLDRIDILYVATENNTHKIFALQAIERGKDVLVEKPPASSSIDVCAIERAANKKGVKVSYADHYTYKWPNMRMLKLVPRLVDHYGPITLFEAFTWEARGYDIIHPEMLKEDDPEKRKHAYRSRLWRTVLNSKKSGGISMDMLIHLIGLYHNLGGNTKEINYARKCNFDPEVFSGETGAEFDIKANGGHFDSTAHVHLESIKFIEDKRKEKEATLIFKKQGFLFSLFDENRIIYRDIDGQIKDERNCDSSGHENMLRNFIESDEPLVTIQRGLIDLNFLEQFRRDAEYRPREEYYGEI